MTKRDRRRGEEIDSSSDGSLTETKRRDAATQCVSERRKRLRMRKCRVSSQCGQTSNLQHVIKMIAAFPPRSASSTEWPWTGCSDSDHQTHTLSFAALKQAEYLSTRLCFKISWHSFSLSSVLHAFETKHHHSLSFKLQFHVYFCQCRLELLPHTPSW